LTIKTYYVRGLSEELLMSSNNTY